MPATVADKTFRYRVETDQGTFEVELDQPVPEGNAGRQLLEELVHEQLVNSPEAREAFDRRNSPVTTAVKDVARGVGAGLRDFGQQFLNLPAEILNIILASASPDPPGPPGTRRPLFPEFKAPQLPDPIGQPKSGLERGVRTATPIAIDLGLLMLPVGKAALARRAAKRTPMMFERGSVAREMAEPRPRLQYEPRSPASRGSFGTRPLATVAEGAGILKTPPSQAARNLSKLFEFSADDIGKMSLERATNARRRIMTYIPDYPLYQEGTPIFELLQRLEQRILSFR